MSAWAKPNQVASELIDRLNAASNAAQLTEQFFDQIEFAARRLSLSKGSQATYLMVMSSVSALRFDHAAVQAHYEAAKCEPDFNDMIAMNFAVSFGLAGRNDLAADVVMENLSLFSGNPHWLLDAWKKLLTNGRLGDAIEVERRISAITGEPREFAELLQRLLADRGVDESSLRAVVNEIDDVLIESRVRAPASAVRVLAEICEEGPRAILDYTVTLSTEDALNLEEALLTRLFHAQHSAFVGGTLVLAVRGGEGVN